MKKWILAVGILSLCITLSYANSLQAPFQHDDRVTIHENPLVKSLGYFSDFNPPKYRQLFYLSFAINRYFGGDSIFGYHLINVLLHILTSVLVAIISFFTISKGVLWGGSIAFRIALITSFLFALNPIQVETVTYISGRAGGLSAFFYLSALLLFILGSLRGCKFKGAAFYFLSCISGIAAILSKETAITLPFIVLLYDICFMKAGVWRAREERFLYYYLPCLLAGGVVLYKARSLVGMISVWVGKADFLYALLQMKIVLLAGWLTIFPLGLSFEKDLPLVLDFNSLGFVGALLALAVITGLIQKRFFLVTPILSFTTVWFFITLAPTNSFIPRIDLLSERNLYLPSYGIALFFSVGFHVLFFDEKARKNFHFAGAGLLLIFLSYAALLIKQNSSWQVF